MLTPLPVDTLARIETPENVWLTFRLAGPWARGVAYLIDLALRIAATFVIGWVMALFSMVDSFASIGGGVMLVYYFFLEWCYGWFFEAFWNGRTLGKRALGIRVVRSGGYPIGFYDAMVRNLLRAADVLPVFYGVGMISLLATRRLQRLGDLAADTLVIEEQRPRLRGRLPQLRDVVPLAPSELVLGYKPAERTLNLIDGFFRRSRTLHEARAAEIASILAGPLAEKLGYEGDLHLEDPVEFLLRVLATFTDRADDAEATKKRRRPRRRPRRRYAGPRIEGAP